MFNIFKIHNIGYIIIFTVPADNNNNSVRGGDNISGRGNNPSKSNTSGRLSADTEEEKLQVYLEWLETEGNQQQSSEPSQSYPFRDRNKQ